MGREEISDTPADEAPRSETVRHTGKVIGHVVRYLPGYAKKRKSRVTVSRPPVLAAFVHILVDDNRYCTVPCGNAEKELDFGVRPTDADRTLVYNTLVKLHPLNEIRHFKEKTKPSKKGKGKTYSEFFLED
jgi:hypothetical protein